MARVGLARLKDLPHLFILDDVHIGGCGGRRQIEFVYFVRNDACVIKGVRGPFRKLKRRIGGRSDYAVLECVAGFEAENADGFYADVLIGGCVDDCGIGSVGDGAGENVGGAAAGVRDTD
jgi:hypothetical protein